ncbi:cyclin-like protein [Geopyxis carbonaria]|nr:cyclin-like protein [Geopyxis carbonaria]
MDVKPQRPSRALRSRPDAENKPALQQKTANVKGDGQKIVGGLKAAARRTVFGDVSNKYNQGGDENAKVGITVQEKKTTAISKPAQRAGSTRTTTSTEVNGVAKPSGISQTGPRRITRKTAVFEDNKRPSPKRVSPKRSSPKVSRNAVSKKEIAGGFRSKRATGPIDPIHTRVKQQQDEPVYSDQQPHLFDGNYIVDDDEDVDVDDYEDVSDGEDEEKVDENARFGTEVEIVSDAETEGCEDDTDFNAPRTRGGDNTTGITAQVMVPKWTTKTRKQLSKLKDQFVTYDEEEEGDISMVAEYGDEIFEYMRELEIKLLPNAQYMEFQSELQWSMRSILMDWLVQVHARFNLLPETMFLCTNYIDRFLSNKVVSLGKLQLVGATALFVAAKYEEINCPSVHEIVYMVDKGYSVEEILKAERFMLSLLQFELGWPGPMSFLRRVSKADDYDLETRTLAKYFLEITIMDERFVGSPPSFLAAGAHCLARHMLKKGEWTTAHTYYSGYTAAQLEPLVQTLVECCENPKEHHGAVYEKYADRRYKRAALFVENWMSEASSNSDE